jgi:hypothetical protein
MLKAGDRWPALDFWFLSADSGIQGLAPVKDAIQGDHSGPLRRIHRRHNAVWIEGHSRHFPAALGASLSDSAAL